MKIISISQRLNVSDSGNLDGLHVGTYRPLTPPVLLDVVSPDTLYTSPLANIDYGNFRGRPAYGDKLTRGTDLISDIVGVYPTSY